MQLLGVNYQEKVKTLSVYVTTHYMYGITCVSIASSADFIHIKFIKLSSKHIKMQYDIILIIITMHITFKTSSIAITYFRCLPRSEYFLIHDECSRTNITCTLTFYMEINITVTLPEYVLL